MFFPNQSLAELLPVIATIDPVANSSAAVNGDTVDMSKFQAIIAVLLIGDIGAVTIDFLVQSSAASNMGTPSTVKAATQLAASATVNDLAQLVIAVKHSELTDGHRYARMVATPGGAITGSWAAVMLGVPKFGPGDVTIPDLATVLEIKK